jgi:hypothetical protein
MDIRVRKWIDAHRMKMDPESTILKLPVLIIREKASGDGYTC